MSKELQRHEGVYTKTSGTCGALADVNIASVAKEHMQRDGLVVTWSVHEVKWGYYKNGALQFSDGSNAIDNAYLQEMRIFNDTEELRITVQNGSISYRYISDASGESVSYVDSTSRMIGENDPGYAQLHNIEGFTHLIDTGRKLSQIIPITATKQYCYLTTRNYIGYLDNHQASYTDYRYVSIVDKEA